MSEERKKRSANEGQNASRDDFYNYDTEPRGGTKKRRSARAEEPKGKKERERAERTERAERPQKPPKSEPNPSSVGNQLAIVLLVVFSLFIGICYAFPEGVGVVGGAIRNAFFGCFGIAAFAVPFLLFQLAIFWRRDALSGATKYKYLISIAFLVFLSVFVHMIYRMTLGEKVTGELIRWQHLKTLYGSGISYAGGGFVGGVLALSLLSAIGYPGTFIFSILFLAAFGMALVGLTPAECYQRYRFYHRRNEKVRAKRRADLAKKREEQKSAAEAAAPRTAVVPHRKGGIDSSIFEDNADVGGASEVLHPIHVVNMTEAKNARLDDIFDSKEEDEVTLRYAAEEETPKPAEDLTRDIPKRQAEVDIPVERRRTQPKKSAEPKPIIAPPPEKKDTYIFPSVDLLKTADRKSGDNSHELHDNADKIVEKLKSFGVSVSISNVSVGPTVTRYELEPGNGVRVRSITNSLDDIALTLAASGVRYGAIAGKSAIGIEVPNKTANMVYIRDLIDHEKFRAAKSRLTVALGEDVSGAPTYFDIAKMPHLLIAGATNSGKSVCINSLLISLLYKARPDEVKLILVDPKKVELNIYNGIPHLLVPVVFDPKKAAGALHWAVTEMERRFELIEAMKTRNIEQYNAAIAGDPTKEFLSQVVIVIDELADLMLTAKDDVEASICRLAQKARAAGMHLVIGTQRPSVDVITGLIKANIPSRIAFAVASQIDSRTIIDEQGAEKLIGRGDMLYRPIGSKPTRVQGAYVSESEIESIVEFIKSNSADCAYSNEIIEKIDHASELCAQKKGKGASAASDDMADDMEEADPMFDSAVELAVESGKISTSLIQRRLSLGYGRAAKLIDMMQSRGIVSEPEGQKPRTVLITREQYLEMKMNGVNDADVPEDEDDAPF